MPDRFSHSVCVYCGSRQGKDPAFETEARAFGHRLAETKWRLVYGAGDVGLMGAVATAVLAAGGEALGVIPTHLVAQEIGKSGLSQMIITETMHERKKVMFMNADAVVVLPGGAGSLEEFFEVLTWAQLDLHAKPIVLLNVGGYWDPLLALVDHVIDQGFADPSLREFITVSATAEDATRALQSHLTVPV